MKNRMRRIAFTAMAAAVAMSTSIPAFAASLDFTEKSNNGHTYDVYQIFTGTYKNGELSEIKWGADSAYEANGAEAGTLVKDEILNELTGIGSNESDQKKLESITKYYNTADTTPTYSIALSKDVTTRTLEVADGYYLIKDKSNPTDDSYSTYIVKAAGEGITVTPKSAKPNFDKTVLDESAETHLDVNTANTLTDKGGVWSETADHSINEVFQFRLNAKLPANKEINDYAHYYLGFTDTLSKEVTYDGGMEVYVTLPNGTPVKLNESEYKVTGAPTAGTVSDADQTFTIEIMDLKQVLKDHELGDSLVNVSVDVVYNAHLNEKAAVSSAAPGADNNQNKAKLTYSNNPNVTGDGKTKPTDTDDSEEDTVFVFTYDLENFKVGNDEKTALAGAHFQIKEGDKVLKFTSTEEGVYVRAKDDAVADGETVFDTIITTASGKFVFKGLDAGTYTLVETQAPGDYNKAADMTIEIKATHKEENASKAEVVSLTRHLNGAEDSFTTNKIVNKRGSNLPETGGMGTALLYTVGGILVIGAGSVLVGKKRIRK